VTGWSSTLLRVHLTFAFLATAAFWIAAFARKGGRTHRKAGHRFAQLVYAAALAGGLLAVVQLIAPSLVRPPDPALSPEAADAIARRTTQTMWLALYVVVILVTPVQHGLAVIAAGPDPRRLRTWPHATLNLLALLSSVFLLPAAVVWRQNAYALVAPIGFIVGLRNMSYAGRTSASPLEWQREHLTSQLTAGIALHTALFVFGTSRTLQWVPSGWMLWIPWLLPAVVGLVVIAALRQRSTPFF
jgi:hypothetical protein